MHGKQMKAVMSVYLGLVKKATEDDVEQGMRLSSTPDDL
jgi:hypothetical protein